MTLCHTGRRMISTEVRMMLIPSRMLIFDEPTNHLDVAMKETPKSA